VLLNHPEWVVQHPANRMTTVSPCGSTGTARPCR